jgi:hypothetical protein
MKLSLAWSKHIKDPKKRKEFEQTILASATMRERLLQILDEDERSLEASMCSTKDFENASWAYKHAYALGEKSRIKRLRDLLELKDRSDNQ